MPPPTLNYEAPHLLSRYLGCTVKMNQLLQLFRQELCVGWFGTVTS